MTNTKEINRSVGGIRAYFIRGHGGWLLYAIWFLVNISILYVILGSELPIIQSLFGNNIVIFAGIFILSYIIVATIIGYVDIEVKGIYGQEAGVYWGAIPQIQKMLKMLTTLVELCTNLTERVDTLEQKLEVLLEREASRQTE